MNSQADSAAPSATLWLGTYPPDGLGTPPGKGEGVWRAQLAADGSLSAQLVAVMPAPSFVLVHPERPLVYAASEDAPAVLSVMSANAPHTILATAELGGADACHLLLAPDLRTLYVSLYSSGELVVVPLGEDGLPASGAVFQRFGYEGSGPREDRQEAAHAHCAALSPGGTHLLVSDLGTDTVWAHAIAPDGSLAPATVATGLPPGSGPRHLAVHGELMYVVCELDHQLRTLRWERGSATAEEISSQPVTLAPQRTGDSIYDAHVLVIEGPRGAHLLASVRGADVMSLFDLSPEGEARYRAAFDTGYWPRHFAIAADASGADRLVVTNERGHEVRAFALADVLALAPETERGAVAQLPWASAPVTSPACIAAPPMPPHHP